MSNYKLVNEYLQLNYNYFMFGSMVVNIFSNKKKISIEIKELINNFALFFIKPFLMRFYNIIFSYSSKSK